MKAAITAVAGYVPESVLTNSDLEKMVETNDEWIYTRTGIKKRHILKGEGLGTSHMAVKACKTLLEKKNISPKEIDMIVVGTVTASKFIESGSHKKILVVGADMMSSIVNYEDRATCILFGDGAGVVLLEPSEDDKYGIQDSILKADGSGSQYLYMKAGGSRYPATAESVANKEHFAFQEGRVVFKAAIKGMADAIAGVMKRNNLSVDDVDYIIPHQANKRIILGVADQLDYPHEKVLINIENYGNTTSATIPLVIRDFEHKFKKGDKIILTAFGGGFTWGAILVTWNY